MGTRKILIDDFEELIRFIPQKPPFVMIDKLEECDEKVTTTNFTVNSENLFCENGFFSEPGIIENMAQTAAIGAGYLGKKNYENVQVGFIGSIKNLNIYFLPEVNTTITTNVIIDYKVMNATIIKATVTSGNDLVAECEMKIFLTDNIVVA